MDWSQRRIEWPARSPDFTLLNVLWSRIKNAVYRNRSQNIDDLQEKKSSRIYILNSLEIIVNKTALQVLQVHPY